MHFGSQNPNQKSEMQFEIWSKSHQKSVKFTLFSSFSTLFWSKSPFFRHFRPFLTIFTSFLTIFWSKSQLKIHQNHGKFQNVQNAIWNLKSPKCILNLKIQIWGRKSPSKKGPKCNLRSKIRSFSISRSKIEVWNRHQNVKSGFKNRLGRGSKCNLGRFTFRSKFEVKKGQIPEDGYACAEKVAFTKTEHKYLLLN